MKNDLTTMNFQRRAKRFYAVFACVVFALSLTVIPALAAGGNNNSNEAMTAINNLSTFIFSLIRAVGLILLGYGVLQVGLSFQSHDPSQRSNGILTIAGGIIIVFTKEILDLITG